MGSLDSNSNTSESDTFQSALEIAAAAVAVGGVFKGIKGIGKAFKGISEETASKTERMTKEFFTGNKQHFVGQGMKDDEGLQGAINKHMLDYNQGNKDYDETIRDISKTMVDTKGTNVNVNMEGLNRQSRDKVDAWRMREAKGSKPKKTEQNIIKLKDGTRQDARALGYDDLNSQIKDHVNSLNNYEKDSTELTIPNGNSVDQLEYNLDLLTKEKGERDNVLKTEYRRNRNSSLRNMKNSIKDLHGNSGKFN